MSNFKPITGVLCEIHDSCNNCGCNISKRESRIVGIRLCGYLNKQIQNSHCTIINNLHNAVRGLCINCLINAKEEMELLL